MSDFLAEALVLVRPDTTKFRGELEAQLATATKGVTVPIPVTAVPSATAASTAIQEAQTQATRETAAAQKAVIATTQEQTRAQQLLGNETLKLTTEQTAHARVNRLIAQSQTQLVEAETLASLKTSELAANRARLAASSRAVASAERAVLAAISVENAALIANAQATLENAQSQELLNRERVRNTIAANAHSAALQREAASEALVARGAGATALSLAGARGATLAASSGFLVGAAAAVFFVESLKQAIDAEDTFRRTTFLLGDTLSTQLADQAQVIGDAFAIDDDDVIKFETQVGKILVSAGLTNERVAQLSAGVVKLAADMAAFNRVPVADTLRAIQLGLAGNLRGLKQFGVLVSNAEISQRALAESGKESTKELTAQELVLARYSLILERVSFQQGAFADQADSLTAQSQRLRVNFEELQETIGRGLVPAVGGLVKGLNDSFDAFNAAASGAKNFGSSLPIIGDEVAGLNLGGLVENLFRLNTQAVLLGPVFGPIALGMKLFGDETEDTSAKLTVFDKIAGSVIGTLGGLSSALDKARSNFPTRAERQELGLTLAQAGGDQAAELAILRDRERRQAAFLARILDQPATTKKAIAQQTKAADNLRQTRDQIQGILDEQASDANKAANEAEKARNDADQAFLKLLGLEQDRVRNRILEAAGTESLKDDLRFNLAFRALLRKQKDLVADTVKDAQRRAQELASLTAALIRVGQEIKDLRQRQRDAFREAQEQRLEQIQTGTRLDIELADINENTRRRVALRQQLIRELLKERRVLKLTGNALKENRNEVARIRKEIEAIQKEEKKTAGQTRETIQQFLFSQLQAQQGFAANLMGNLIPTGQTAGLVGVPAPPAPGRAVAAESLAAEGKRTTGPTAGLQVTTNDILGRILQELRKLNGSYDAPEAIHQKKAGAAAGDTYAVS